MYLFSIIPLFLFKISVVQASELGNAQSSPNINVRIGANLNEYAPPVEDECDIRVPTQYNSIQTAINMASVGDTICVGAGEYSENLFINKPIRLSGRGAIGRNKSIIKSQDPTMRTVSVSANNVIIEGFLIIDAGTEYGSAAVHHGENISGCIVRFNKLVAGNGGLAFLTDNAQHGNLIKNNIMVGNMSPFIARVGQFDNNKPSDKVDFINNTFIGSITQTSNSDTGAALNAGAPNSLVKRNVFNVHGTILALVSTTDTNIITQNNFNTLTPRNVSASWSTTTNAENNWWGDLDPTDNIYGYVDFTPFATKPFTEN